MKKTAATLAVVGTFAAAGCTVAGKAATPDAATVVVGYQSKTINTVTAGTLLRAQHYFEKRLGPHYKVVWQDYDTGAPITAQMLAGKIDIGSMGDYPLLINGSRSQAQGSDAATELVSITGYNLRGALNGVVVAQNSTAQTLRDLKGRTVSTSVGSAGHGTLVQALRKYGLDATKDIRTENQQPPVGASSLQAGNVAALAQFVAWPGVLVQKGQARLLYDGGDLGVPTFHGVVVRRRFATEHTAILQAFLKAQIDATDYLHHNPLKAAEIVASATGLAPETVYLYNGAGGVATFDPTIKPSLRSAFEHDVPFLTSIGVLRAKIDVPAFFDDSAIRRAYGPGYDAASASTANPAAIQGTDAICRTQVQNPARAGEIWLQGEESTHPAADPVCLLRNVRAFQSEGRTIRAAYIPDATTGTRWFADRATWVAVPGGSLLPFATPATAQTYLAAHPGAHIVSYAEAVKSA